MVLGVDLLGQSYFLQGSILFKKFANVILSCLKRQVFNHKFVTLHFVIVRNIQAVLVGVLPLSKDFVLLLLLFELINGIGLLDQA